MKRRSFPYPFRQNIFVLEALEITGLFFLLGLLTAYLGLDENSTGSLALDIGAAGLVMLVSILLGLVMWGVYLLLVLALRKIPLWLLIPAIFLTGGILLVLLAFLSALDLNRFLLASLLYQGEAPVEYFWSKESGQARQAWKRGEVLRPAAEAVLPILPADTPVLHLHYAAAPIDLAALRELGQPVETAEERRGWRTATSQSEPEATPKAAAEAFYNEMLLAGPENCWVAFLHLLPDRVGRGGVASPEDLRDAWLPIWQEVKDCLAAHFPSSIVPELVFDLRLHKVQGTFLDEHLARVECEVILIARGGEEAQVAVQAAPHSAAWVRFENYAVREGLLWLLVSGQPGSRIEPAGVKNDQSDPSFSV